MAHTVKNINKMFTGILNKRVGLVKFLEKSKIMEENQVGFTKNRQIDEHLFRLQFT